MLSLSSVKNCMHVRMVEVTIPLTALVTCVPCPPLLIMWKKLYLLCSVLLCSNYKDPDLQICWPSLLYRGYAVSRVVHCIQSQNLFGNPGWYLKWFDTSDCLWLTRYLGPRIIPPSLGCPPPPLSTCQWAGGQMIPVSIDCQALNSLNSVLRWTKAVSLLET